jgi:hypothetical protein
MARYKKYKDSIGGRWYASIRRIQE